jgi:RND family efflux transporter MFP subunit
VLKKYRELGDTINYGGQAQAGGGVADIAQLADTEDMRAEVDINEADIAKVSIGSAAAMILDAYPKRHFNATLVKVYPEADRQKGTVKVEVRIENPDLQIIKPEMSAKVTFQETTAAASEPSRLTVPASAIQTDHGGTYVWLVREGVIARISVTRGREIESGVEVESTLSDGDTVVMAPPATLGEGQRVSIDRGDR